MEFEAVDEGTIAKILVPEGSDGVKVGTPIAILAGEGEDVSALRRRRPRPRLRRRPRSKSRKLQAGRSGQGRRRDPGRPSGPCRAGAEGRYRRSHQGLPTGPPTGRGAGDRSVDAEGHRPRRADRSRRPWHGRGRRDGRARATAAAAPAGLQPVEAELAFTDGVPHEAVKLSQHAQDDRAAPDRVEAADPAYLSDARLPASMRCSSCAANSTPGSPIAASSSVSTTC